MAIPTRTAVDQESTLTGEDVVMTLDQDATAHIMAVLTDLYSDPEQAVLREYSTNAADSHIEAGQTRPIEVELPTPLRPMLVVRDFGIGLDADGIRDTYSRYGASTKRATNDQNGTLGLGCKSALTYTDQYTVVGTKDGIRTTVSITRSPDGGGTMKIVATKPTDEPNGVEVSVPVQRDNRFDSLAGDFFRHWPTGSVLVNGSAPAGIEGGVQLNDEIRAFKSAGRQYDYARQEYRQASAIGEHLIVMGNVAYPVPENLAADYPKGVHILAHVPIGSVDFAPSREALMDTRLTRDTIARIARDYRTAATGSVQRAIDAAPDQASAIRAWSEAAFLAKQGDTFTYRGTAMPTLWQPDGGLTIIGRDTGYSYRRKSNGAHHHVTNIDIDTAASAPLWITDYDNAQWTGTNRAKLDAYLAAHPTLPDDAADNALAIKGDTVPNPDWIDPSRIVSWANTIRPWKDPSAPKAAKGGGRGKFAGTYPIVKMDGDHARTIQTFDATALADWEGTVVYRLGASWHGSNSHMKQLSHFDPTAILVNLSHSRAAKFKRLFPEAKPFAEHLSACSQKWLDGLTQDEKLLATWSANTHGGLDALEYQRTKVNDPELRELLRLRYMTRQESARKLRLAWRQASTHGVNMPDHPDATWIAKRYPLLTCIDQYNVSEGAKQHLLTYVNDTHTTQMEEQ